VENKFESPPLAIYRLLSGHVSWVEVRKGKEGEGNGREGKGREGKRREEKRREGKGREGKGRQDKGERREHTSGSIQTSVEIFKTA
jgi:hypothetical protein